MPADPPPPPTWHATMTGYDPREVREIRHAATAAARRWGVDEDSLHDLALVVGELASNAFLHVEGDTTIDMRLTDDGTRLYLQFTDSCPYIPDDPPPRAEQSAVPDPSATDGRGLAIVAALAGRSGAYASGDGKVMWRELPLACAVPARRTAPERRKLGFGGLAPAIQ